MIKGYESQAVPPFNLAFSTNDGARGGAAAWARSGSTWLFSEDLLLVVLDDTPGLWVAQRALSQQMTVTSPVPRSPQASSGID